MDLREEKDAIKKARTDKESFCRLYNEHYAKIFNYILRRVVDFQIAEDITSEVFLRAFKKLWLFRWKKISFSNWLYTLALHEISNYFRKSKYPTISLEKILEENGFEPFHIETPETELIEAQAIFAQHVDFLKVQKALLQLPLKYQEVLSLKFFEHKKIREICEILGKREGTIKSLLSRGTDKLKILVQADSESNKSPIKVNSACKNFPKIIPKL